MDYSDRWETAAEVLSAFDAVAALDRTALASAIIIALTDGWKDATTFTAWLDGLRGIAEEVAAVAEDAGG